MNRFEIVFRKMDETVSAETAEIASEFWTDADAIAQESDAIEAIMRMSREIAQQTECACFTSA